MKKQIFTGLLLLAIISAKTMAQDSTKHFIGVKGGISIPNLTAGGSVQNELNTGYSSSLGPNFAIFYEGFLSKKFSLTTQFEYAAEGGKKDGFQALTTPDEFAPYFQAQERPVPPVVYADYKSKAKMDYLMLSELAKVSFALGEKSHFSFFIDAGPFAGLLISAHQITKGTSDIYADKTKQENITELTGAGPQSFNNKEDIKDNLHKGNFGIEGDLGFALNIKNSRVFIEGGGNYGFLNIQKRN